MKVKCIEPMIDVCPSSAGYGQTFGVVLTYFDGHRKRYSDMGLALCADLTIKQREYIKNLMKERDERLSGGKRIAWLDSANMDSHIHRTLDNGQTTVCGHRPRSEAEWKITSRVSRAAQGRSRYCKTCFAGKHKKSEIQWLEYEDPRLDS